MARGFSRNLWRIVNWARNERDSNIKSILVRDEGKRHVPISFMSSHKFYRLKDRTVHIQTIQILFSSDKPHQVSKRCVFKKLRR